MASVPETEESLTLRKWRMAEARRIVSAQRQAGSVSGAETGSLVEALCFAYGDLVRTNAKPPVRAEALLQKIEGARMRASKTGVIERALQTAEADGRRSGVQLVTPPFVLRRARELNEIAKTRKLTNSDMIKLGIIIRWLEHCGTPTQPSETDQAYPEDGPREPDDTAPSRVIDLSQEEGEQT